MTPSEHYKEAERLLEAANPMQNVVDKPLLVARAQTHAVLALVGLEAEKETGGLHVEGRDFAWLRVLR